MTRPMYRKGYHGADNSDRNGDISDHQPFFVSTNPLYEEGVCIGFILKWRIQLSRARWMALDIRASTVTPMAIVVSMRALIVYSIYD